MHTMLIFVKNKICDNILLKTGVRNLGSARKFEIEPTNRELI